MKTLYYSVRLKSLESISHKAFKVTSFDGSTDIIPKSCVIAPDNDVTKSDAWWIAAWILPKKSIQYSSKKQAWFDEQGQRQPTYHVSKHAPEKVNPVQSNEIVSLRNE